MYILFNTGELLLLHGHCAVQCRLLSGSRYRSVTIRKAGLCKTALQEADALNGLWPAKFGIGISFVLQDPETWLEAYGYDSFDHAYTYSLFLGQDARGNWLPVRQLRDRYSQHRKDVYPKENVPEDNDTKDPLAD